MAASAVPGSKPLVGSVQIDHEKVQAFGGSPAHEDMSLASLIPNSGIILIGEGAPEVEEPLEKRQQLQLPSGHKIRVSAPALRDGNVLCSVL
jgi:hypothetical protein